ncbi:Uncharacterized protein APZ42_021519 [Daphnia magna]|uniref:Uncharacterized protein n=1 Tax=Daphnia magna TaxID=35525 RepID=A0A164WLA0_9CRUS|nr:Uncharacterized protein APZ42_021519 [Daphnia magna]
MEVFAQDVHLKRYPISILNIVVVIIAVGSNECCNSKTNGHVQLEGLFYFLFRCVRLLCLCRIVSEPMIFQEIGGYWRASSSIPIIDSRE